MLCLIRGKQNFSLKEVHMKKATMTPAQKTKFQSEHPVAVRVYGVLGQCGYCETQLPLPQLQEGQPFRFKEREYLLASKVEYQPSRYAINLVSLGHF